MRSNGIPHLLWLGFLLFLSPPGFGADPGREGGKLFAATMEALEDLDLDRHLSGETDREAVRTLALLARHAGDLRTERRIVHELLSRIPWSHLALYSRNTYRVLEGDLEGEALPTFGLYLTVRDGEYYADRILEDGPAAEAGIRRWDHVIAVDGAPPEASPRLDWRCDDAFLSDPACHLLLGPKGRGVAAEDRVDLTIGNGPGDHRVVTITAKRWSALDAARASRTIFLYGEDEPGTPRFGYIHFWYVHRRSNGRHAAGRDPRALPGLRRPGAGHPGARGLLGHGTQGPRRAPEGMVAPAPRRAHGFVHAQRPRRSSPPPSGTGSWACSWASAPRAPWWGPGSGRWGPARCSCCPPIP